MFAAAREGQGADTSSDSDADVRATTEAAAVAADRAAAGDEYGVLAPLIIVMDDDSSITIIGALPRHASFSSSLRPCSWILINVRKFSTSAEGYCILCC